MTSRASAVVSAFLPGPLAKSAPLPTNTTQKLDELISPPLSAVVNDHAFEKNGIATTTTPLLGHVDPDEDPLVAVMGCGYVGTNLIAEFSRHYNVMGFDVKQEQLETLKAVHGENSRVTFTLDAEDLIKATHFLISVPTLLQDDKTIDTSYIRSALALIGAHARSGSTVIIESSVAVGMTRDLVGPLALKRRFWAGMSPERVDPGRTEPAMHTIPKVVSGLDDVVPGSVARIHRLYSKIFDAVITVSKPEVAEMMKLYENCQRMMCIAYVNEMADACGPLGIDPFEVCSAAASKPFGYMPFTPSLGVGGHCIPVNPYYLLSNGQWPLLQAATEKMWQRPAQIGQRVLDQLLGPARRIIATPPPSSAEARPSYAQTDSTIDLGFDQSQLSTALCESNFDRLPWTPLTGSTVWTRSTSPEMSSSVSSVDSETRSVGGPRPRVLVVGVGFKPGQSVLSNSPGQKLVQFLSQSGLVDVWWADPLVKQSAFKLAPRLCDDSWDSDMLDSFDMIVVAIRQSGLDFSMLGELKRASVVMCCT